MAYGPISAAGPEGDPWRREFRDIWPDLTDEDIVGSGFAVTGYTISIDLGSDAALARLRERLRKRGPRLMLDFVPKYTGLDHPWVEELREYYVAGSERFPMKSAFLRKQGSCSAGNRHLLAQRARDTAST